MMYKKNFKIIFKKNYRKNFKKLFGRKSSNPERHTGKFRNRALPFMNHDTVRVAGSIICHPPGNRDQLPSGRCYVLDAHGNRNAVRPAAVSGNPECLIGEREDGAAMGNAARVHLAGTVHGNAGETFGCFKNFHTQKLGKLTGIEDPDLFSDCR
jgi:hypothetical protein